MDDSNPSSPAGPDRDERQTAEDPVERDVTAILALVSAARAQAADSPFSNPVLAAAYAVSRQLDAGILDEARLACVIARLRDAAAADRAARLGAYVGGADPTANSDALGQLARDFVERLRGRGEAGLPAFQTAIERVRYACVFTAHPTFAVAPEIYAAIADAASGKAAQFGPASHRPRKLSLEEEFDAAAAAIGRGRDATDRLTGALLDAAKAVWPSAWQELNPGPVIMASWVGLDTDGRTDIGWWDSLRLRLRLKRLGLARLTTELDGTGALADRVRQALSSVDEQLSLAPAGPSPDVVEPFARALVAGRDESLLSPDPLLPLFADAIASAEPNEKKRLCVARAGVVAHGLSLAHTHVRLNAAQVHNAVRIRLGFDEPPAERSRRRSLLADMDEALADVRSQSVDFGALVAEQASAMRLMMLVAQIAKHVDRHVPVRFLVAETRSGYTLLATLWLARLCGCERHVEISPLFETADALEDGVRVLEEALRSAQYRSYVRGLGRVCLQFGYSDSGRYLGQLSATYLVERLKLRLAEVLTRYGLDGVEVVLFDTHGESIGRGAHPGSLADRLDYLSPPAARAALAAAAVPVREESSFQGGDGYLLFATPELALATIARVAEHALRNPEDGDDPIYTETDFAAGFFATVSGAFGSLVEDPGYAALLGAFGPALLDSTGSRPTARQNDAGGPAVLRHPSELRAIPNNAILQQLGWCANTMHGLGIASARDPETFADLRRRSARFARALDFVAHAARHSDLSVLRATLSLFDPGYWLDQAMNASPAHAERCLKVADSLRGLGLWTIMQATVRLAQADQIRLRQAWPDLPRLADREAALHAVRLVLVRQIWLLAADIPEFSPRHGATPDALRARLLRLDVPGAIELLAAIFPRSAGDAGLRDYGEPPGPAASLSYAQEHVRVFDPIRRFFDLTREITVAIGHETGSFG